MDGIHQYNRVITLQRTVQPLLHIGAQVVNHARNAGFAVMLTVNLTEDLADLPLGQTPAIKAAGQTFALQFLVTQQCKNLWMEVAVTVTWNPEFQNTAMPETATLTVTIPLLPLTGLKLATLCQHHTLKHDFH